MTVVATLRALALAGLLALACRPAAAGDPGESQRYIPGRNDQPGDLVREIYAVTPRGTMIHDRYLSAALMIDIFFAAPAGLDVLYGDLSVGDAAAVRIVTLNATGSVGDQPTHATVLAYLSGDHPFGRRYSLAVEDSHWVVRDICIMPEGLNLSDTPGWDARAFDRDLGRTPAPEAGC